MKVNFVLVKTEKGKEDTGKGKMLYMALKEVDGQHNLGLAANEVFKEYTAVVELEKGMIYKIEVHYPQVVLRCET